MDGGGDLTNVSNPYAGWKYDSGPGGYDRTHNVAVNFIYEIPFFERSPNRLVTTTAGGWELSGIITMTSGLPINPQLTGGQSSNGLPNATTDRTYGGQGFLSAQGRRVVRYDGIRNQL